MTSFQRITGAQADVNELLYISALHQTCSEMRTAGAMISSVDIKRFLMSRYNIKISHPDCIKLVRRLGGAAGNHSTSETYLKAQKGVKKFIKSLRRSKSLSNTESSHSQSELEGKEEQLEEYLDLIQILSLLLVPTLVKAYSTSADASETDPSKSSDEPLEGVELVDTMRRVIAGDLRLDCSDKSIVVDEAFVKKLLLHFGEYERAEDDNLVQAMVHVANIDSGKLSQTGLIHALTHDVLDWDASTEARFSSYEQDVMSMVHEHRRCTKKYEQKALTERDDEDATIDRKFDEPEKGAVVGPGSVPNESDEEDQKRSLLSITYKMLSSSPVDFVLDSHTSVTLSMLVFAFYTTMAGTYFGILVNVTQHSCQGSSDGDEFMCTIRSTIRISFGVPFLLACFGVALIMPLSLGNNPRNRRLLPLSIAFISVFLFSIIPYTVIASIESDATRAVDNLFLNELRLLNLVLGFFIAVLYLIQIGATLMNRTVVSKDNYNERFFTTSSTRGEARTKMAGIRKISLLVSNALQMHTAVDDNSEHSHVLDEGHIPTEMSSMNFVLYGEKEQRDGGILPTLRDVWSSKIFEEEGIWLPTRLLAFQVAQGFLAVAISALFLVLSLQAYREVRDLKRADGFLADLVPSETVAAVSLFPACCVSILVMATLIALYIPSASSTILKFRSGAFPSLGSALFMKYRVSVDLTYMNFGNAIYSMVGSAILSFIVVFVFILLFAWDRTRPAMLHVVAWTIGLGLAIGMKLVLTMLFRSTTYRAFYRLRPRVAPIVSLILECWHIGIGSSVLLTRFFQFLGAAVFWLGRIDSPFLDDSVVILGYRFDSVPTTFVKDLLVHEAHRHPYLEKLAQIYRLGLEIDTFGNDAGAAWRQILVLSIFPWLRKYRTNSLIREREALKSLTQFELQRLSMENTALAARVQRHLVQLRDMGLQELKGG